jgi:uncharacterized protein
MKNIFNIITIMLCCFYANAQSYESTIVKHRDDYIKAFLNDEHSPLKQADLDFLRFYTPNKAYQVIAKFKSIIDTIGFNMQTHSGKLKHYYIYGQVTFILNKKCCELYIYRSNDLAKIPGLEEYLFLPFADFTNSRTTFGGGRYLDFNIGDIVNQQLIIDFNKAYNPYCAFAEGYSCPIPPSENKLKIRINAGEKLFGKVPKEAAH